MRSFPHRHGDGAGKPETRDETRGCRKTSISCETSSKFDIFEQVGMPQSVTPATQNRITTCFVTSPIDTERFCNFPHRHGEARGKPETRDETRWIIRISISCETLPPIFTLKLQTQRFPTSFLMNLQICYLKIDVSCEASVNFSTSQKMPRPPRNLNPVPT